MTIIDALHGRERVRRAQWLRRLIVGLTLLALLLLTFEQLARINVAFAASDRLRFGTKDAWVALIGICLGGVIGGLSIDRFGLKAVVGIVLVGWCGITVIGAASDPAAHLVLAPMVTGFMPGAMLAAILVAARLALAPRRRGFAIALLLTAYFAIWSRTAPSGFYALLFETPDPDVPASWQYPMFALAAAGAALAAIWLLVLPEADSASGLDLRPPPRRAPSAMVEDAARLLGNPAVLSLVAIQICGAVVGSYALEDRWTLDMLRTGALPATTLVAIVGVPVAFVAMAAWSDWVCRRTRCFLTARRPFVVAGFLAAAFAPLAARSFERHEIVFTLIAAIGIGAMRVGDLIVVDLAPRRVAGLFIGTILTVEATGAVALNFVNVVFFHVMRPLPAVVMVFAILGAVAAALLIPLMRPDEDARRAQDAGIADRF